MYGSIKRVLLQYYNFLLPEQNNVAYRNSTVRL